MTDVVEYNAITGEILERDFTPEEASQRAVDSAASEAASLAAASKVAADAAARDAAIAHAKSLGFTDEMIAVMYPSVAV